jgi:hypothetical protein
MNGNFSYSAFGMSEAEQLDQFNTIPCPKDDEGDMVLGIT